MSDFRKILFALNMWGGLLAASFFYAFFIDRWYNTKPDFLLFRINLPPLPFSYLSVQENEQILTGMLWIGVILGAIALYIVYKTDENNRLDISLMAKIIMFVHALLTLVVTWLILVKVWPLIYQVLYPIVYPIIQVYNKL